MRGDLEPDRHVIQGEGLARWLREAPLTLTGPFGDPGVASVPQPVSEDAADDPIVLEAVVADVREVGVLKGHRHVLRAGVRLAGAQTVVRVVAAESVHHHPLHRDQADTGLVEVMRILPGHVLRDRADDLPTEPTQSCRVTVDHDRVDAEVRSPDGAGRVDRRVVAGLRGVL